MESTGLASALAALLFSSGGVTADQPTVYQPRENLAIIQVYELPSDDRLVVSYSDIALVAQDEQESGGALYTDPMPLITAQDIDQIQSGVDDYQAMPVVLVSLSEQGVEKARNSLTVSDEPSDVKLAFALWGDQVDAENPEVKLMGQSIAFMGSASNFPQQFQISGGVTSVEDQQRFINSIALPIAPDSE